MITPKPGFTRGTDSKLRKGDTQKLDARMEETQELKTGEKKCEDQSLVSLSLRRISPEL